jgi:uncharacterized Rmd1/YagE family protein
MLRNRLAKQIPSLSTKIVDEVLYIPYFSFLHGLLSNYKESPRGTFVPADEVKPIAADQTSEGHVFIFDYGVVITWGLSERLEHEFCRSLVPFCTSLVKNDLVQSDILNYRFSKSEEDIQGGIFNDIITLKAGSGMPTYLTISHAIAQSVKLELFEELVEKTIATTQCIPHKLAKEGKVGMTQEKITKRIGAIRNEDEC